MITILGSLLLFFTFPFQSNLWTERASSFLPWAFLFGLFFSLALLTTKSALHLPFLSVSWPAKGFLVSLPLALLGLLTTFIPAPRQGELAVLAFVLFFLWLDALLFDVWSIRRMVSFDGTARLVQTRLRRALRSRNLHLILAEFESTALFVEEAFSLGNSANTRKSSNLFLSAVEQVLTAIPQVLPPKEEKEAETLLDMYAIFQAEVAKKLESLAFQVKKSPHDIQWELLIKMVAQVTALFLSIQEHLSSPFLLIMEELAKTLQESHSPKEMELYAGCVEAIKGVIEHALSKKKDARVYTSPLLNKLEYLMKERFRRDRTINPAYLMQPFAEIATFLTHPSFSTLVGREEIVSDLKRILSQFAVLETISERLGETHPTDTASTYQQEIPYLKPTPPEQPL